jgi:hypothetical protein
VHFPDLNALLYIGLLVGIVAAHLLALLILNPVLVWIDRAALAISGFLTKLLTAVARTGSPVAG